MISCTIPALLLDGWITGTPGESSLGPGERAPGRMNQFATGGGWLFWITKSTFGQSAASLAGGR